MSYDPRLEKLADVLVNYSLSVKPGQWVALQGDVVTLPALRALHEKIIVAGGHASLFLSDEAMQRSFYRLANEEQLTWINPMQRLAIEQADARVSILGSSNTRAMTGIDSRRVQKQRAATTELMQIFMQRSAQGEMNWTLAQFPTEANAQEANMSLEDYADFVYSACYCDREDPVAEWRKVQAMQQHKVDYLKGKKQVRCQGPNIDLTLSIEGRTFINADGSRNMPDGEIFTGPVEDSVNGWVRFSYPSIVNGQAVSGIELTFEQGKVVKASAEVNDDLLQAQLDTDAGARYLGEFAIGTNFGIQRFTSNILFDEKIGGTIHMAIGNAYPETGGKNRSAVHWDMICDMREDSQILVDGELFYENGQFTV